jgi:hypothetical protein
MSHGIGRSAESEALDGLNGLNHLIIGAAFLFPGKLDGAAYTEVHRTHHTEPTAELLLPGNGIPNPLAREREEDRSLNPIRKGHTILLSVKPRTHVFSIYATFWLRIWKYIRKIYDVQPKGCMFGGRLKESKMEEVLEQDFMPA